MRNKTGFQVILRIIFPRRHVLVPLPYSPESSGDNSTVLSSSKKKGGVKGEAGG
jgi:hypothetical protein